MFLRKIFTAENKLAWVVIDLLIVIIGVYCAFLIQEYAAQEKTKQEKEEVISALKYELEFFRILMPGRAWYSNNQTQSWEKMRQGGRYIDYSNWRFVEPQYKYQMLEYALQVQNREVINFELYQTSQLVYEQIRRIEHTESIITELGMRYQSYPEGLSETSESYKLIYAKNMDNFSRLINTMKLRGEDQGLLAERATSALILINEILSPDTRKRIEQDLIIQYIGDMVDTEEEAVMGVRESFPNFEEDEIREMYRTATKSE